MNLPTIKDIFTAYGKIKPFVHRTPVLTSQALNARSGAQLFFKCENLQKVGAFKFRGATNAILSLTDEQARQGVATHSSGNHAQALALAARMRGIPAYIVMPTNSPQVKKDAVAGYGAEIIFCEPTLQARESTLQEVVARTGAEFIHPYDNYNVIAGQGTAALELLESVENLDYVLTPVGGGGLLSGTLITISSESPTTKVIAAEPKGADDAWRSLQSGTKQPSIEPKTICDGLLTSLSEMTFEIIRKHVYSIITVSDESVIMAMRLIWERMKIIVEPSSATVLAAILDNQGNFEGKRIGLILSGGNVDLTKLSWN